MNENFFTKEAHEIVKFYNKVCMIKIKNNINKKRNLTKFHKLIALLILTIKMTLWIIFIRRVYSIRINLKNNFRNIKINLMLLNIEKMSDDFRRKRHMTRLIFTMKVNDKILI